MAPRISKVKGAKVKTEDHFITALCPRSQATVQLRTFTRATGDGALHVLQEPLDHVPRVPAVPTRLAPREPRGEHAQLRVLRYKNICYGAKKYLLHCTDLVRIGHGIDIGPRCPTASAHIHQADGTSRQGFLK